MKILVTGTAGFIGYHVANRLLARGDEIVGALHKKNKASARGDTL